VRILYLSLSYVPSRRASSVQVMNTCAALGRQGHDVTLVAKRAVESTASGQDDHAFYGVDRTFRVDKVSRPAPRGGGLVFAAGVVRRLLRQRRDVDLVYCRDIVGASVASELGMPVAFEAHGMPTHPLHVAAWRRFVSRPSFRGLVAISDALRRDIVAAGLAPPAAPVVVAHDAASVGLGRAPRRALGAPPRIGYVGSLYPGRGVEIVLDLARRMPDVCFDVVGGSERDLARWKAMAMPANLQLHGFQPPARLATFYATFDVVLLPHPRHGVTGATGTEDISRWTSPMKMFEYMASGVPLIASDLPVLQEVLTDGQNAVIAPAGDAAAWEQALRRLLGDDELRVRLATAAQRDLQREYTWDARSRSVLTGLGYEAPAAGSAAAASGSPGTAGDADGPGRPGGADRQLNGLA
jgi:glycosyltransferase involved in cell wall biosynthesis